MSTHTKVQQSSKSQAQRRSLRARVPALTSLVSKAFARHAINGAIAALDAPGNPFNTESPNTFE